MPRVVMDTASKSAGTNVLVHSRTKTDYYVA
jgi:hypothetical protein